MQKHVMILEVSQKQNYIFASRKLKENIQRSDDIAWVTSSAFFEETCPRDYDHRLNMVYSGGGHTVVAFDTEEDADRFARAVTTRVLRDYPGMELFVKRLPYNEELPAGENLNQLSKELEIKKSQRQSAFRTWALGVEKPRPVPERDLDTNNFKIPSGWNATAHLESLDHQDNFLAVIHIDGNNMGKRVQRIYDSCGFNWNECVRKLDLFSKEIDEHFAMAFDEMAEDLARELEKQKWKGRALPLRKIIGAGDDLCFITTGKLGMECAASFLRHLSSKKNKADQEHYTACAGVVLIHKKYPFHKAYEMSEALCRSAKAFVSQYGGSISAVDFHVEYGQMKSTLAEIRQDYCTDDGGRLELRPVAVTNCGAVPQERTYGYLKQKLRLLKGMIKDQENDRGRNDDTKIARSKVKILRGPFHQGEWETKLAMRMQEAEGILVADGVDSAFYTDDKNVRRNRYFDAIELLDVTNLWQEVYR